MLSDPPWPRKFGPFSEKKFNESLEPVTVIHASRVADLEKCLCPEHGAECSFTGYPEAEYVISGGQHRTQEGGRVFGPDWEFQAAELLMHVTLQECAELWWNNENRGLPGVRERFIRQVVADNPAAVALTEELHRNGFGLRRGRDGRRDFTAVDLLQRLWEQNQTAARLVVTVLGETSVGTRGPLVRALFEIASWDLGVNQGVRVDWSRMTDKISTMETSLRQAEEGLAGGKSVAGGTKWARVANFIAMKYNVRRTTGRVGFPAWT